MIASLNGATEGGWTHHARLLEGAGADALELNVFLVAADPHLTSADIEHRYVDLVGAVASEISIPLAVKIAPYFTSLAHMAARLVDAGADVTMMASALLERGPEYLGVVLGEVAEWLDAHDYHSVEQARGSMSQRSVPDPSTFARVQYMRALTSYTPTYNSGTASDQE